MYLQNVEIETFLFYFKEAQLRKTDLPEACMCLAWLILDKYLP